MSLENECVCIHCMEWIETHEMNTHIHDICLLRMNVRVYLCVSRAWVCAYMKWIHTLCAYMTGIHTLCIHDMYTHTVCIHDMYIHTHALETHGMKKTHARNTHIHNLCLQRTNVCIYFHAYDIQIWYTLRVCLFIHCVCVYSFHWMDFMEWIHTYDICYNREWMCASLSMHMMYKYDTHVSNDTHTTPPALTEDAAYPSATLYHSMYTHTHTHTHTHTYTHIHVYIQIHDIHLTIKTHTTAPALTEADASPPSTHSHSMYILTHIQIHIHTRIQHLPWHKPLPRRLQLSIIQIAPLMQDLQFGQFLIDGWLLVLNSWQVRCSQKSGKCNFLKS